MTNQNITKGIARTAAMLIIVVGLLGAATDAKADLVLKLEAANYAAGTWTDTSGLGNHAGQGNAENQPTLVASQTANGASVVQFDGDDFLDFPTILPTSDADGFTVCAFVRPDEPDYWRTIVAGQPGGFTYGAVAPGDGLTANAQFIDRSFQAGLGHSNTGMSSTEFSSINVLANDSGGSFRLNGVDDGTADGSTFDAGIFRVGASQSGSEGWEGDIAEIRVYNTQLTLSEIQAVEAELNASYVVPEPSSLVLAVLGMLGLAFVARRRR